MVHSGASCSPLQLEHVAISDDPSLLSKLRALDLNLEAMSSVESVKSPMMQVVSTAHNETVNDTCRCADVSNVLDKSARRESAVNHNVIKQFAAVANANKSLYLEQEYLEQQVLDTTGEGGAEDRHRHDDDNDVTERQHGVGDTSAHDIADLSAEDTPSATARDDVSVWPLSSGDISVQPSADASTGSVDVNTDAAVASATTDEVQEPSSVSSTPLQLPADTGMLAKPSDDAPVTTTAAPDECSTDDEQRMMDYSDEEGSGTNKNMESSTNDEIQLSRTEPHTTIMEDLNMLLERFVYHNYSYFSCGCHSRYQSIHDATSLLLSPDYANCSTEDEVFEPENFEKLPNDIAFHSFLNKLHIELTACES